MRLAGIRPGDLVQADVRGFIFHAWVERREGRALYVEPLSRNVSYHRLTARQVIAHWRRTKGSAPISHRSI